MDDLIARLKAANADIERRDETLSEELHEKRNDVSFVEEVAGAERRRLPAGLGHDGDPLEFDRETIVMRTGRPVLAIVRDHAQLTFSDPESSIWRSRLENAASHLIAAARAVGRIEVEGHSLAWLGTGWLVAPDVVVTNRHVASEFGRQDGASFVFRQGLSGRGMTASIDFLEEVGSSDSLTFRLEQILYIEDSDGPDLAFLRVSQIDGQSLTSPIGLSELPKDSELVAVIGFPARDSRIPDQALMDEIFGQVYDKKRLAPGQLTRLQTDAICHDCSTLGGNSGSVVLSLDSGKAVGLHFAGRFLQANFAVPSTVVGERLDQVRSGATNRRSDTHSMDDAPSPANDQAAIRPRAPAKLTYVIPLRVTVEIGDPYPEPDPAVSGARSLQAADYLDDDEVFAESVPADYSDRHGYVDTFLGDDAEVPLPLVTTHTHDVLSFTVNGNVEQVLRYEHFSVLMSKSRRLCRFSAVNIDGQRSIPHDRVAWRIDPRVPTEAQIKKECYGNAPRFARGHMTRREDPIWGDSESASKGNSDSMHVTNAVPQMQPFNAGIWLELENYALQNARRDDMKISVFTGPFLAAEDPVVFGVRIPVEFWKVIAFIHDETGELCATGYTMSQRDFLSEDEFVYGKHKTSQRSIASIEQRAGLSFGHLTQLDPFEELEGFETELTDVRQIQFRRRYE